jgi:3-oxoacyl-[acyl-carrier-protein] synthase II
MSPLSKLALGAASFALTDSGLGDLPPRRTALHFCSRSGSTEFLREYHEGLIEEAAASPLLFTNGVANAPAGHISLEYGIRGPCSTLMGGPASAVFALADAVDALGSGRFDVLLVGAAEELSPFFLRTRQDYASVTADAAVASPPGEGGVFLVLESPDHARARGARVRARITVEPDGPWDQTAPDRARQMGLDGLACLVSLGVAPASPPGDVALLKALAKEATSLHGHAVRYALGDVFAASVLTQVLVSCMALHKGEVPATPPGADLPTSVASLFPARVKKTDLDAAFVLVPYNGAGHGVIRILPG